MTAPKFIDKPYFLRTQNEDIDEQFGSIEEAIEFGQTMELAPFSVCQLLVQPVRLIHMNKRPSDGRRKESVGSAEKATGTDGNS